MKHENRIHFLANQTPEQMMSFVIETADDKIIVIDGGAFGDGDYLLKTLREVSGQQKPSVDAWFLTHPHTDHIGAIVSLLRACPEDFEIKKLYYNFPSRQFLAKYDYNPAVHEIDCFYEVMPLVASACETITQGDVYQIGEAKFEVLYTTDASITENVYNNSSAVLRMTLGGQTVLFLADLGIEAGNKLVKLYGTALHSDFVQMAHHGQNGVEKEVYEAAAPKACLWCTPQWLWDNDAGKGYNTHEWKTIIVQGWMQELGVKHHFANKDGDFDLRLPYPLD